MTDGDPVEFYQLEDRLEIARRRCAGNSFAKIADRWRDSGFLAGKKFLEIDEAELSNAADRRNQIRAAGRKEGRVRKERGASRTVRAEKNLIRLEVGGLEQHAHAIRELPFRDTDLTMLLLGYYRAALRWLVDKPGGKRCFRVWQNTRALHTIERDEQLAAGRIDDSGLLG